MDPGDFYFTPNKYSHLQPFRGSYINSCYTFCPICETFFIKVSYFKGRVYQALGLKWVVAKYIEIWGRVLRQMVYKQLISLHFCRLMLPVIFCMCKSNRNYLAQVTSEFISIYHRSHDNSNPPFLLISWLCATSRLQSLFTLVRCTNGYLTLGQGTHLNERPS
jgi:hypothetical protein